MQWVILSLQIFCFCVYNLTQIASWTVWNKVSGLDYGRVYFSVINLLHSF